MLPATRPRRQTVEISRESIADLMAKLSGPPVKPYAKKCNYYTELATTQVLPAIEDCED